MGRHFKKGENILDARARWKLEAEQESKQREIKELQRKKQQFEVESLIMLPLPIPYVQGDKKLSILICSIKNRKGLLQNLVKILEKQSTDDVEILVEVDNKEITIGAKRNILLKRARGDYVSFVDDDDLVSDDYVSKILKAIKTSPDCCGIEGEIDHIKHIRKGENLRRRYRCKQKFVHSIRYTEWYEQNKIYYRCPNHLNPIKRKLAGQVMFPEKSKGEDKDFSLRLKPLLKIEVYIDGIIYYYRAIL